MSDPVNARHRLQAMLSPDCTSNPAVRLRGKGVAAVLLLAFLAVAPVAIIGCGFATRAPSSPPSLGSARSAFRRLDLARSHRIYTAVAESKNAPDSDKVVALEWLAQQDWQFYRDYPSALRRLHRADSLGISRGLIWREISNAQRRAGQYAEARAAARTAQALADSADDEQPASLLYDYAVYDEAVAGLKRGIPPRRELLDTASRDLRALLDKEPWHPAASVLLLGVSLLRDDGLTALYAWRSYYWLNPADSCPGLLAKPGKELAALLPTWKDRQLSTGERQWLMKALAQSGFYKLAALLAADPRSRQGGYGKVQDLQPIREIIEFEKFASTTWKETEEFYRRTAVNGGRNGLLPAFFSWFRDRAFRYNMKLAEKRLWRQLSFAGERPPFDEQRFAKEMERRFGLVMLQRMDDGYYGVKAGCIIGDEPRAFAQYSCMVSGRYVLVDRVFCDTYATWFGDAGGYDGLARKYTIYLFRSDGVKQVISLWRMAGVPKRRAEMERYIQQHRATDDSLARENPYAYLPALRARLGQRSSQRLFDSLQAAGSHGGNLRRAFLAAMYARVYIAPSYAHEGRHAIDAMYYPKQYDLTEIKNDLAEAKKNSATLVDKTRVLCQAVGNRLRPRPQTQLQ